MKIPLIIGVILAGTLSVGVGLYFTLSKIPATIATPEETFEPLVDSVATPASSPTTPVSFIPPTGFAKNIVPNSAAERRLLITTSVDGETFTNTSTLLTDQGDVPDAVVTEDGTIMVYYIGASVSAAQENTVVAVSKDDGRTWKHYRLTFDLPSSHEPSDPDVVILPDGTFRMYYTGNIDREKLGILYAESTDGYSFTYKGIAFAPEFNVIDSTTFMFNNTWYMLVLDMKEPKQYWASSTDGKKFTYTDAADEFGAGEDGYIISNPISTTPNIRVFGFNFPNHHIRSFTSGDLITWTKDDGVLFQGPKTSSLNEGRIGDSTIVQKRDGTYLLIYTANIPK